MMYKIEINDDAMTVLEEMGDAGGTDSHSSTIIGMDKTLEVNAAQLSDLLTEARSLRHALQFYGNSDISDVIIDNGDMARSVLERIKKRD